MQSTDAGFIRSEDQARLVEMTPLVTWSLLCKVYQADIISACEKPEQTSSPDLHGAVLRHTAAQPMHCQTASRAGKRFHLSQGHRAHEYHITLAQESSDSPLRNSQWLKSIPIRSAPDSAKR